MAIPIVKRINSLLDSLKSTKADNRTAIMEKGVTVYADDLYSTYPTRISQISMTSGDKDAVMKGLIENSLTTFDIPVGTSFLPTDSLMGLSTVTQLTIPNTVKRMGNNVCSGMTSLTSITVPGTVEELRQYLFHNCTSLQTATLGEGITYMGEYMFNGCTSLTTINFPSTLKSISGLGGCTSLTSVTIPNGVEKIYGAFNNTGLTSVSFPDTLTQIGSDYGAFRQCTELTSVTIPDSVTRLIQQSFYGCTGLTSVTIGTGITYIDRGVFSECTSLQSITIKAVTPPSCDLTAFYHTNNCPIYVPEESVQAYKTAWTDLAPRIQKMPEPVVTKQIFVPVQSTSDVTTGKYILAKDSGSQMEVFNASLIKQTTSLRDGINNNYNITYVGNSLCRYGSGTAIVPHSDVTDAATFDYDALAQKTYWVDKSDNDTKYYLTPYGVMFDYNNPTTVPSTNITVGTSATSSSQNPLTFITFMTPNSTYLSYYDANNSYRFGWYRSGMSSTESDLYKLVDVAAVKTAEVTLLDTTTGEIYDYNDTSAPMITSTETAYYKDNMVSIRINDNVTEIVGGAFSGCRNLTSVNIPDSVTQIEISTFYYCVSLPSVNIPDNVTSIGNYAFGDCTALATVTIGTGIQSIGDYAFGLYDEFGEGLQSVLTSVTVKATTPPTIGTSPFNDEYTGEVVNPNLVIYVPSASVDAYKSAWSEYADRIQAIPS